MTVYYIEYTIAGAIYSAICLTEELAKSYCINYGLEFEEVASEYTVIEREEQFI